MNYKILREVVWETLKPIALFIGVFAAFLGYIRGVYYILEDPATTLLVTLLTIAAGLVGLHIRNLYLVRVEREESAKRWRE